LANQTPLEQYSDDVCRRLLAAVVLRAWRDAESGDNEARAWLASQTALDYADAVNINLAPLLPTEQPKAPTETAQERAGTIYSARSDVGHVLTGQISPQNVPVLKA
jgi:hypothetical protein